VLVLSGIKVVDVPQSSWIIVGALIACGLYLAYWARNARLESRAVAVRSLE
jgi:hypothetical protein